MTRLPARSSLGLVPQAEGKAGPWMSDTSIPWGDALPWTGAKLGRSVPQRRRPSGRDGLLVALKERILALPDEGKHVSVSAICISSGAPQSTALRKLAALEAAGLVRRYLHGTDRRRVCLSLTEKGTVLVNDLVAEDLRFFSALTEGQRLTAT